MTPLDLTTILRRAEEAEEKAQRATPGPWTRRPSLSLDSCVESEADASPMLAAMCADICGERSREDAAFIASARSDVPTLAADVRALAARVQEQEAEIARLRAVVEALPRCNAAGCEQIATREAVAVDASERACDEHEPTLAGAGPAEELPYADALRALKRGEEPGTLPDRCPRCDGAAWSAPVVSFIGAPSGRTAFACDGCGWRPEIDGAKREEPST